MTQQKQCGCGRSPTGFCNGWHNLTNEQYTEEMKKYGEKISKQLTESSNVLLQESDVLNKRS